jgi:hypothetical protein
MPMDQDVPVTGGCLCGAVRYEARAFLGMAYYCHCTICQKTTGAPFEIGVLVKAGTLRFTGGTPSYFQSSSFGKRGFCPSCGSRLLWAAIGSADDWQTNVAACSLDSPGDVRPSCHTYTDTKLPWLEIADDLPRHPEAEMDAVISAWKAAVAPD